jgi:shikimate dehydrogenase
MRKFGLIGYPLGHSFSKKYFTEKFVNESIPDCVYENYPLSEISQLIQLIQNDNQLCGLNVTIPYKSVVFKFLDSISPEAEEIGSVNVVKILRDKGNIKLVGFNSDVTGIKDTLFPYFNRIRTAIVLGTGGSSRSVCYVLKTHGIDVLQVSRTQKPGLLTYSSLNKTILAQSQLIVNTTPVGMFPDVDSKPDIDYSVLGENHILFDLVYNPVVTSFLKEGVKQGAATVGGLKMLHSQAEKSWNIWNDDSCL